MKIIATSTLAALAVLAVAFVHDGATPAQAQSAPVEKGQTPGQADQARAQDRSRAEGVKIERDWKAQDKSQDTDRASAKPADSDRSHETVGRDWRAHPNGQDR
jgi:hypothetical protein